MKRVARSIFGILIFTCMPLLCTATEASDIDDLHALLDEFLADVDNVDMHDRFWADDLVYTSSNGTRTNKAEILASMREANADDISKDSPSYAATDVDIRLYDDMAIVAFRLVATTGDNTKKRSQYLNTGSFLKRNGVWQVVAWQATRIPDTTDD
ncbi:MAG TPA: nuclear transport factor 2 family protein [Woeseiaceae bacterium]|nr:nuclear transport factor 2 family protein [Woeseiaceae bacterium]